MQGQRSWSTAALLLPLFFLATVALVRAQAGDCYSPANLTTNCDFNEYSNQSANGQIRQIAVGWNLWVEAGSLAVDQAFDSPSPPSQRFWSNGDRFTAGLWQQVGGVTPGATYLAGLVWAPHGDQCENCIERKIGLDPTGGIDPTSPNIVWGAATYDRKPFDIIRTRAVARSSTITVFIRVHNPMSHGIDEVFLDGAWLYQDTSVPPVSAPDPVSGAEVAVAAPPPPTETPVPASPTIPPPSPTPLPPTATPSPSATTAPEPTATATATTTPSPSPSATPTATATTTAAPSATATLPPPTATPTPTPAASLAGVLTATGGGWPPVLAALGVGGGLLVGGLVWRRTRQK